MRVAFAAAPAAAAMGAATTIATTASADAVVDPPCLFRLSCLRGATDTGMDEQRALLDQLMGMERNLNEEEKLNRKKHFSDDDVCKLWVTIKSTLISYSPLCLSPFPFLPLRPSPARFMASLFGHSVLFSPVPLSAFCLSRSLCGGLWLC